MRPRLFTAENEPQNCSRKQVFTCFNEAAALHRGKRQHILVPPDPAAGFNEAAALHRGKRIEFHPLGAMGVASMRPRLFTAENACTPPHVGQSSWLQ